MGALMKIISRYLITTVIKASLVIALLLVGVDLFIELANAIGDMGQGQYGLLNVFEYVFMILPTNLYHFSPMIGLLGGLIGLGILATNSELVVMRTSGFSGLRIFVAVGIAAICLSLIASVVGEFIAPSLQKRAVIQRQQAIYGSESLHTKGGLWVHMHDDFLHAGRIVGQGLMFDVNFYTFDHHKMTSVRHAEKVAYVGKHWEAHDVSITQFKSDHIVTQSYKREVWQDLHLAPRILIAQTGDVFDLSMVELWSQIHFLKNVGLAYEQYELALWQRAFQPLATIVMILLAIPFVFGSLRTGSTGLRLMVGVVLGVGFYVLNQFSGQFALVYGIPPLLAALFPILVFSFLGIGLMFMRR
jgi:lipopolysaccharide export system permease protein